MKVYTIFGTTGEYSDRSDWAVVSYLNEDSAKEHVRLATRKAREWEVERDKEKRYDSPPPGWSNYDPAMQMDYTGTYYYYETTEITDFGR